MRSKGVAMENSLEKMFNIPLLNTFQKLVIIGSSLTELHQFIQMTLLWTFMSASTYSSPVPFKSSCSYDSAYSFLGSQQDDDDY